MKWHRETDWIAIDYTGPNLRGIGVLLPNTAVLLTLYAAGVRDLPWWGTTAALALTTAGTAVQLHDFRQLWRDDPDQETRP